MVPMAGNNSDYIRRLRKDGKRDLLEKIENQEISVYAAAVKAGYRKTKASPSRTEQIAYHWSRASAAERQRFIVTNWSTVGPIADDIARRLRELKESET